MVDLEAQENKSIPIYQKLNLTFKEASEYSNIGENTLRELIKEDDCDFALYIGKKCLIKRKKFEEYIDRNTYLK